MLTPPFANSTYRNFILTLLLFFAPHSGATGQTNPTPDTSKPKASQVHVLVIDQKSGDAILDGRAVSDGDSVKVRGPLAVFVKNTNSALFDCGIKSDKANVPEIAAAFSFLKALTPYTIEAATAAAGRHKGGPPPAAGTDTATLDSRIDDLIHGKGSFNGLEDSILVIRALQVVTDALTDAKSGIKVVDARTMFELKRMSTLAPGEDLSLTSYNEAAEKFCDVSKSTCMGLKQLGHLTTGVAGLAAIYSRFATAVFERELSAGAGDPTVKGATALLSAAGEVVDNQDKLVDYAYAIQKLAHRTAWASNAITCDDTVTVKWNTARTASISIDPVGAPALARTARVQPFSMKVTVLPDWIVRPAVGLSFLRIPQAKFDKFAVKKVDDTTFNVQTSGSTDNRFTYGLSLGATWRHLDYRDRPGAFALWLPELTVNPSSDVKAFAVGGAVSLWVFKFGAGVSWTKHTVLDNLTTSSVIKDADLLATRDTYGRRMPYVSISLIGIPPFVP